jgi:hypothetical protein
VWRIGPDIIERARHPFSAEPIRTLDALHLASALAVRSVVPAVELLSLMSAFAEPRSCSGSVCILRETLGSRRKLNPALVCIAGSIQELQYPAF